MEERWDKKDSEINFLEMEQTKPSVNLGDGQEDTEKKHLPSLPSKEYGSVFDFFLLIHFNIISLQQAPSLPGLFASTKSVPSQ